MRGAIIRRMTDRSVRRALGLLLALGAVGPAPAASADIVLSAGFTARVYVTGQGNNAAMAGAPQIDEPGRFGRWVSERFNDWPEGSRTAALEAAAARQAVGERPTDG